MNKNIETVLNNKNTKATDFFELVNTFDYAELTVHKDGNAVVSIGINQFEPFHSGYLFGQKCNDTHYIIDSADIKSVSGRMLDDMDTFLIEVPMADDSKVSICIYHTDTNEKTEIRESYYESDVFSLLDYFNDKTHKVIMAKVNDTFGFEILFKNIKDCTFEEVEEYQYKLHLVDGNCKTVDFPLVDDSINEIFAKEGITSDIILIRTFGQPFTEISLFVQK